MESTKYPRSAHFLFSEGAQNDDRICFEHEQFENTEIVISEKLDGQNDSIAKRGVFARSHGTPTQHPWDKAIWDIWERVKKDLDDDTYIFGENMYAIHSIQYKQLESYYYMFGVRVKDEWLAWDDVKEWAYMLDLPTVPELFRGKTSDIKTTAIELCKNLSTFDGYDTKTGLPVMEGLVCRRVESFKNDMFPLYLNKMVRKGHVNTDEHWTRNWKRQPLKWELESENKKRGI